MAPHPLFLREDENWRKMLVLNALFSALLLAFSPVSLLSLPQEVIRNIRDREKTQRSPVLHAVSPTLIFFGG